MTARYAVVGNPIGHSKSPLIHTAFARQTGQDMTYEAILAPLDGFVETVRKFRADHGMGMNVTVPFKLEAWKLADTLTPRARLAQAVNTLKFEADGTLLGDNTDGAGLVRDIEENLGFPLQDRRILLMGAGGAARGVLLPLLERTPAALVIANRTAERAQELAQPFASHGAVTGGGYPALAGQCFDLVINATSSGLSDELPPLPGGIFAEGALAYELMYGRETPFMAFARNQGAARVSDGLGMLVEQAAESFFLWRGVRPETASVIRQLRA